MYLLNLAIFGVAFYLIFISVYVHNERKSIRNYKERGFTRYDYHNTLWFAGILVIVALMFNTLYLMGVYT